MSTHNDDWLKDYENSQRWAYWQAWLTGFVMGVGACALLALFSGCVSPMPRVDRYIHAPNYLAALVQAENWDHGSGHRHYVSGNSGSMRPAIEGGDFLLARDYVPGENLIGRIVIYNGTTLPNISHRVTAQNSRAVYIEGDHNPKADGWIARDRIISVVEYIVDYPR